jgi:hypothetical protein
MKTEKLASEEEDMFVGCQIVIRGGRKEERE